MSQKDTEIAALKQQLAQAAAKNHFALKIAGLHGTSEVLKIEAGVESLQAPEVPDSNPSQVVGATNKSDIEPLETGFLTKIIHPPNVT